MNKNEQLDRLENIYRECGELPMNSQSDKFLCWYMQISKPKTVTTDVYELYGLKPDVYELRGLINELLAANRLKFREQGRQSFLFSTKGKRKDKNNEF